MKSLKAKLIVCNVLLGITLLLLLGSTFAYFTDRNEISNTLTSGNVSIKLTEAAVVYDASGNLVADDSVPRIVGQKADVTHHYGTVHPGQLIHKDPIIENVGSEKAWLAAKITLTDGSGDLHQVIGFEDSDNLDLTYLFSGGVLNPGFRVGEWQGFEDVWYSDGFAMVQVPNRSEGSYDFYFFFRQEKSQNDSVMLFDTLTIPDDWDNEQLSNLKDFKITVRAFGVQTKGFADCYSAMTTAFPDYFTLN